MMNTFQIEYKSYMGDIETMTVNADTKADAKRIFNALRPLSEIREVIDCE